MLINTILIKVSTLQQKALIRKLSKGKNQTCKSESKECLEGMELIKTQFVFIVPFIILIMS